MDPNYPLVPVFNFFSAFLLLLLQPWRFYSWSVGIRVYVAWLALLCMCIGVNSVVWKDNTRDVSPAWCEFVIRVQIGGSIAAMSCTLAIVRRLYIVTCSGRIMITKSEKRRALVEDLMLSLGVPIIVMALAYVVQSNRYNVFEEVGCMLPLANTWLTYVLVLSWPLVFGIISSIYAMLIIRTFITRRKELNEVLSNNSSSINYMRFYCVLAITFVDNLLTIPIAIIIVYVGAVIQGPILPWTGWADIHENYSLVGAIPASTWRDPELAGGNTLGQFWTRLTFTLTQWAYVMCAFWFIALYGMSAEVVSYYKEMFWRVVRVFGWERKSSDSTDDQAKSKPRRRPSEISTISFQSGTAGQSETVAPCIQSDMQESNSDIVQLSDTSIDTRVDEYIVSRDLSPIEMEKMHKNNPRKSGEFSMA